MGDQGKGKGAFTGACWSCGNPGHRSSDCPNPSEGEKKRRAAKGKGKGDSDKAVTAVEGATDAKDDADGWGFTLGSLVTEVPRHGKGWPTGLTIMPGEGRPTGPSSAGVGSNRFHALTEDDDTNDCELMDTDTYPALGQSASADGPRGQSATADGTAMSCKSGCMCSGRVKGRMVKINRRAWRR